MTSQKLENLLNLALNSAEDEREKSLNLNVGYDPLDREWDLIIKYSVNLDRVRKIASKVTELQNEYAVIRITESRIDILSGIPEVEYVEKPKRLFFQAAEGRRVSCINAVQDTRLSLYGQGILVAIIDSGIDYANIDFRNADGSTRIRYLWDQSLNPTDGETAPVGYSIGVEYTKGQIDEALNAQTVSEQRRLVRSQDISGHGTAVAGVAAGNGSNSGGRYAGVAMQSELIVVKLGNPIQEGFPRTTELMMGIDYIRHFWSGISMMCPIYGRVYFASEPEMKRQVPGILPVELFQKEKRQSSLQFRADSHRSVSRYGKNIRIK